MKYFRLAANFCFLLLVSTATTFAQNSEIDSRKGGMESPPNSRRAQILQSYELGKTAESIDDFSKIISLCEQGLETETSKDLIKYGREVLAWAYWKRGAAHAAAAPDDEKVLADFNASVKYDSEAAPGRPNWKYLHDRGITYAVLGQTDNALADFNRVIALRPSFGKAYFNRGEVWLAAGQFAKAISDFNLAQRRGFKEAVTYARCGLAYHLSNDIQRAIAQYDLALTQNPRDYETFTYRGDAYAASGNYQRAVRDYQQALKINARFSPALFSSAWLRSTCPLSELRDARIALRNAQSAIEVDGENQPFHYKNLEALAAALALGGNFRQAVEMQQTALAIAPETDRDGIEKRLQLYNDGRAYISDLRKKS